MRLEPPVEVQLIYADGKVKNYKASTGDIISISRSMDAKPLFYTVLIAPLANGQKDSI